MWWSVVNITYVFVFCGCIGENYRKEPAKLLV